MGRKGSVGAGWWEQNESVIDDYIDTGIYKNFLESRRNLVMLDKIWIIVGD